MEHEIIGHANKAIKIMKAKNKSFWEKSKEILTEILIIVFAVSFAAFIERTRENFKERAEAKEFVLGLKGDLADEIGLIQTSKNDMDSTRKNYLMILQLTGSVDDTAKMNYIKKHFSLSTFNTRITNGRYDGFKSSGKIQTIENDSLRNDILQFYQQDIPLIDFTENIFNDNQKKIEDLLLEYSDATDNKPLDLKKVITSARTKLLLEFALSYTNAVSSNYDGALKEAKKIEAEIDKAYN